MTKFCKDCKHLSNDHFNMWCAHPNFGLRLDTGKPTVEPCIRVRKDKEMCGEEAKWFEQAKCVSRLDKILKFLER